MTGPAFSLIAGLVLAGSIVTLVVADPSYPEMPNDALTPGKVATTDQFEVCAWIDGESYSRRHRVWEGKRDTLAKYGLPLSSSRDVEDDDRVPVCLGGDNASPLNHWPQVWEQARIKDRFETHACREVCRGVVPLAEAQSWFTGDWRAQLYRLGR